jgi:hypothetical protein
VGARATTPASVPPSAPAEPPRRPSAVSEGTAAPAELARLIQVYTCEASPAGRRVRETLCSLEVPHVMHTTAEGSGTQAPAEWRGASADQRAGCPEGFDESGAAGGSTSGRSPGPGVVVLDPSSGFRSSEVREIIEYLTRAHATGACREEWVGSLMARYLHRAGLRAVGAVVAAAVEQDEALLRRVAGVMHDELRPAIRNEVLGLRARGGARGGCGLGFAVAGRFLLVAASLKIRPC